MATLTAPKKSATANLGEPPPKGIHLAVCLDVVDTYNDRVLKYGAAYGSSDDEDYELKNRERFIFGVKCKDGSLRKIATRAFTISLHEKAALRQFITSWLGESPKDGFDTATLKGKGAQLTLVEDQRGDKTYINIGTISEVMEELLPKVPKVEDFGASADNDNTGAEIPF
jgi:hypothetical protein